YNPGKFHAYDPEIDSIFHRLIRSPRSSEVYAFASDSTSISFAFDYANIVDNDYDITNSDSDFGICISKLSLDNMIHNNKTLKELATPDIMCQPWCEDPHKYLKEFHVVSSTMRRYGIPEDYIKMKTFPFSLDGTAND
ncbi:hypothetical protein CR513_33265, partial [Mucuna pruriens]